MYKHRLVIENFNSHIKIGETMTGEYAYKIRHRCIGINIICDV